MSGYQLVLLTNMYRKQSHKKIDDSSKMTKKSLKCNFPNKNLSNVFPMIINQYVQIILHFLLPKYSTIYKIWLETSILHYTELDLSNF